MKDFNFMQDHIFSQIPYSGKFLVGENFGELQAKLHLAKKTLANLSQPLAFSDITSNWQIKLANL